MTDCLKIHVQQQQDDYVAHAQDISDRAATAGEAVERLLEKLPRDSNVEFIISIQTAL